MEQLGIGSVFAQHGVNVQMCIVLILKDIIKGKYMKYAE